MYVYYKYAPDGTRIVVLSYIDDCVYWYISKALGKWFTENLGNKFHAEFLIYVHWFMSIRISQMKDYFISVDQARYAISIMVKYLDTTTFKKNT